MYMAHAERQPQPDEARRRVATAEPIGDVGDLPPLVVIDVDDLQADMHDSAWQDFLHRAGTYRRRLRERGNLH